jgi:Na+/H+-dicarboxylate symporter
VLPLTATIKISKVISGVVEMLFLAHAYGMVLTTETVLTFIVTVMLVSFSSPGTPGGAPTNTLPAYLAAGLPIEAVILLEVVDPIPDALKAAINVTGQMAGATVLGRLFGMTANVTQVEPASGPLLAAAGTATDPEPTGTL